MSYRVDDEMVDELRELLDRRASEGTDPVDELLAIIESVCLIADDSDILDGNIAVASCHFDAVFDSCQAIRVRMNIPHS